MKNNAPIGVFDSGIGGLTVVKELIRRMPGENLIYFGDTARVPYGSRPVAEIKQFMDQILRFFAAQQIKLAVVACNTMTTVGLQEAVKRYPFPMVGMNTGVHRALQISRRQHVGVIATEATIAGGKHAAAALAVNPQAQVFSQACPKFVPLIEQGRVKGPEIEAAAREYLLPMKEAGIDALIIGCTHYSYITPLINRIVGSEVALVDPAGETTEDAYGLLEQEEQFSALTQGTVRLCVSGDVLQADRMASLALEPPRPQFKRIRLQDFP
ncbi:MAG: glutamate racemase [Veillonellales bacterium]